MRFSQMWVNRNMTTPNTDAVVDEFTGGAPRASEWRALRLALENRLRDLRDRRAAEPDPAAWPALDKHIATLTKQVTTLGTEEVVARFVEDSIQATVARAPEDLAGPDDG